MPSCGTRRAAAPFHLLAWKRAVESTFGHRAHYLMAVRGGGLEGVLPLFEVRGLLGGRGLVSVPYAVYGGICASSEPARAALLDAARELATRTGAQYVELRHRANQQVEGLPTKSLYVTFSRSICANDEENLSAIPRKQRRMTRQGAKFDLRAEVGRAPSRRVLARLCPQCARARLAGLPAATLPRDRPGVREGVRAADRVEGASAGLRGPLAVLRGPGAARTTGAPSTTRCSTRSTTSCTGSSCATRPGPGCRTFDFGRSREGTGRLQLQAALGLRAGAASVSVCPRERWEDAQSQSLESAGCTWRCRHGSACPCP